MQAKKFPKVCFPTTVAVFIIKLLHPTTVMRIESTTLIDNGKSAYMYKPLRVNSFDFINLLVISISSLKTG